MKFRAGDIIQSSHTKRHYQIMGYVTNNLSMDYYIIKYPNGEVARWSIDVTDDFYCKIQQKNHPHTNIFK